MNLQQQLLSAFPHLTDLDFGHHATDLYVVAYPEVVDWLKTNYPFYNNITRFKGIGDWNGSNKTCLDIPFAGGGGNVHRNSHSLYPPEKL